MKFVERCLLTPTPNPNPVYTQIFQFKNKHRIELGTGCGITRMGLALLSLNVVLTNIAPVPLAFKRNVKKNTVVSSLSSAGKQGSDVGRVKISQLYWNNEKQIQVLKPPFAFIVVTDVIYLENIVQRLISTMYALSGANTVILLGYQIRSPEAQQRFWQICPNYFIVEKVPHEDLHPEYVYEEIDVYILRKKMT